MSSGRLLQGKKLKKILAKSVMGVGLDGIVWTEEGVLWAAACRNYLPVESAFKSSTLCSVVLVAVHSSVCVACWRTAKLLRTQLRWHLRATARASTSLSRTSTAETTSDLACPEILSPAGKQQLCDLFNVLMFSYLCLFLSLWYNCTCSTHTKKQYYSSHRKYDKDNKRKCSHSILIQYTYF